MAMTQTPGNECGTTRLRRGGIWCVLLAASAVIPWLAGCDKLPKTSDFLNKAEKKEEPKPAAAAPQAAPTQAPMTSRPAPAPVVKKRTPQEVLGDFNRTQPEQKTDALLSELAQMEDGQDQVTKVNLRQSQVTDTGLKHLEKLDAVTDLDLGAVGFSNAGLQSVASMKNVETLSLESTPAAARAGSTDPEARFLDSGLARIKQMPKLRSLRLDRARFSQKGLSEGAQMADLEELYLESTGLSDESLEQIKGLQNLRVLKISDNPRITDKAFLILAELKNLESLDISRTPVDGHTMEEVRKGKGLAKLTYLSVAFTKWGDRGMMAVQKTNTLEYLDLGDTNVNDNNLRGVKPLKNLQHIYLHQLENVTDAGMVNLASLKELRTIYLNKTRGVSDQGLTRFAGLKKLERLVITETSCTEAGVRNLKKKLPDVSIEK